MSADSYKVKKSLVLTARATQPVSPDPGEIFYNSTSGTMQYWNGSVWIDITASSTAASLDIQRFTTPGVNTWNKPANAKKVTVALVSGTGGSGSGRCGAAGTVRCGGGTGVAGSFVYSVYDASDLPSSVSLTVGAKGIGGAAVLTSDTNGVAGTTGGSSSFGTSLFSPNSSGGAGGTAASGAGGTASQTLASILNTAQVNGTAASTTGASGVAGASTLIPIPTTGGSGGGVTAANAFGPGGTGGGRLATGIAPTNGGAAGTTEGASGSNGLTSLKLFYGIDMGTGGGGGAGGITTQGGAGGNAGGPGATGGGGGGGTNTFGSGKGGDGFSGIVVVITEF